MAAIKENCMDAATSAVLTEVDVSLLKEEQRIGLNAILAAHHGEIAESLRCYQSNQLVLKESGL